MRIKESNYTKKPNFESMYLFYSKSDVEKMKNKNDINLSPLYGIEDLNSYILPKCAVKFNLLKAEVKLVDSNDEEVKMDDNNTIFFPPYMLDRKLKFKCKIFVEGNQKEVEDFYSKGIVVSPYRISNNNVKEKLKVKGYRETNEEKMEKYVCLLESYKAKNLELVKNYIKNNISFKMKLRNDLREISWESTKDMYIDCYIKYKNSIFFEEMIVILNNKYEFRTSNDNDKIYFEMSDKYVIFLFRNFGDDGDDIEEAFIDCRYKASGRSNLSIRTRGVLRNKNYYLRSEVTENDDTLFYVFGIGGIILISFILLISIMGVLFYYMVLKELMGDNNLADKKEELKNVSS
uniref:ZP domain-containing protein n=1 Tax=Parastrongyloides trichosuri TaxID=131310 RepID=A0A0N4ZDD4_PARTI